MESSLVLGEMKGPLVSFNLNSDAGVVAIVPLLAFEAKLGHLSSSSPADLPSLCLLFASFLESRNKAAYDALVVTDD